MLDTRRVKPLFWIGDSRKELRTFPEQVQDVFGYALHLAQTGAKHPDAKPLKGFHGAGVLEVVEEFAGNAYRAIYSVRMGDVVYVLHAFQKKSKSGVSTPRQDMELVRSRLKLAQMHYEKEYGK